MGIFIGLWAANRIKGPIMDLAKMLGVSGALGGALKELPAAGEKAGLGLGAGLLKGLKAAFKIGLVIEIGKLVSDAVDDYLKNNYPDLYNLNHANTPDVLGRKARNWIEGKGWSDPRAADVPSVPSTTPPGAGQPRPGGVGGAIDPGWNTTPAGDSGWFPKPVPAYTDPKKFLATPGTYELDKIPLGQFGGAPWQVPAGVTDLPPDYNNMGKTGYYHTDPMKIMQEQGDVQAAQQKVEEQRIKYLGMQQDAVSNQDDINKQQQDVIDAEQDYLQSLRNLKLAERGEFEDLTSELDAHGKDLKDALGSLGVALDPDLGISKGLAGIADNMVKFFATLGAAPLLGKLKADQAALGYPNNKNNGSGLVGILAANAGYYNDPTTYKDQGNQARLDYGVNNGLTQVTPTGTVPVNPAVGMPSILQDTGHIPSGVQSRTAASLLQQYFGSQIQGKIGGSRDNNTAKNTHDTGTSIDIPIAPSQRGPGGLGDQIKEFLQQNAAQLGLKYSIWRNRGQYPGGGGFDQPGHQDHVDAHFTGTGLPGDPGGAVSAPSAAPAAATRQYAPAGSGAEGWRNTVSQVVAQYAPKVGIPANQQGNWVNAIVSQIDTESKGQAGADNPHDSNGRGGTQHVAGLLQYLPSTYANSAQRLTGNPDMMDPVSQIAGALLASRGPNGEPTGIGNGIGWGPGGAPAGIQPEAFAGGPGVQGVQGVPTPGLTAPGMPTGGAVPSGSTVPVFVTNWPGGFGGGGAGGGGGGGGGGDASTAGPGGGGGGDASTAGPGGGAGPGVANRNTPPPGAIPTTKPGIFWDHQRGGFVNGQGQDVNPDTGKAFTLGGSPGGVPLLPEWRKYMTGGAGGPGLVNPLTNPIGAGGPGGPTPFLPEWRKYMTGGAGGPGLVNPLLDPVGAEGPGGPKPLLPELRKSMVGPGGSGPTNPLLDPVGARGWNPNQAVFKNMLGGPGPGSTNPVLDPVGAAGWGPNQAGIDTAAHAAAGGPGPATWTPWAANTVEGAGLSAYLANNARGLGPTASNTYDPANFASAATNLPTALGVASQKAKDQAFGGGGGPFGVPPPPGPYPSTGPGLGHGKNPVLFLWDQMKNAMGFAKGGEVPIVAHSGEHVLTTRDVSAMGGQQGVYDFRSALHYDGGGAVSNPLDIFAPSAPPKPKNEFLSQFTASIQKPSAPPPPGPLIGPAGSGTPPTTPPVAPPPPPPAAPGPGPGAPPAPPPGALEVPHGEGLGAPPGPVPGGEPIPVGVPTPGTPIGSQANPDTGYGEGLKVQGGIVGAAMSAAASAGGAMGGGGAAASAGMQIAIQEIQRAIEFAGQAAAIGVQGLQETFLPSGGSDLANNNWLTRIVGGLAGAAPAIANVAGQAAQGGKLGAGANLPGVGPSTPEQIAAQALDPNRAEHTGLGAPPGPVNNTGVHIENYITTDNRGASQDFGRYAMPGTR
jgi:hypothetical protein